MAEAKVFFESIDELPEPRPFPAVAQRIIAACESPDVEAREVSEIIQCDPAVSLRLMRMANSSMYGFSGEIRSVEHAIVALGLRSVKELGVSVAASEVFAEGEHQGVRQQMWLHSLACGAVAAQLAPRIGVSTSEAFLAGVVHDVGKLLLLDAVSDSYIELTQGTNSSTIIDTEERCFGVNHQQVGARCANEWGLPLEISAAIEFHHTPDDAFTSPELAGLISLANSLAIDWGMSSTLGKAEENLEEVLRRAELQLSEDDLADAREPAMEQLNVMQEVCS